MRKLLWLQVSRRVDLAALIPHPELAGGGFCLANPGEVYLVWAPQGASLKLDLTAAQGKLQTTWINPVQGTTRPGPVLAGGRVHAISSPLKADRVLWLRRSSR